MGGRNLILLDTHVLIWADQDIPALGPLARDSLDVAGAEDELAVSAMTFWEVAMLHAKSRIEVLPSPSGWRRSMIESGLVEIPVTGELGIAAVELADLHQDPADRIILATALQANATLMTADERILRWPGNLDRIDARR